MTTALTRPEKTISKEVRSTPSILALSVVQTICYVALCMAALESAFYLAHVGDSEYIKPDLTLGFKPMENKELTQRREGFGSFKFNSFGMQNDQITMAKAPGVLRIAVLGDSYVESVQVDRQRNYISLLAQDLSRRLKRKVEVLNFGVANYSIAQDYLRYLTLAQKFAPDLVILGFRVEEVAKLLPEPTSKLASVRPVFFPGPDGKLTYDNTCVRCFLNSNEGKRIQNTYWLRRYSRSWGVIGGMVQTVSAATSAATAKPMQEKSTVQQPMTPDTKAADIQIVRAKYTKSYWYIMDSLLNGLAGACRANHSQLMIMRTPSGNTSPTETALLLKSAAKIGVNVLDIDQKHNQEFGHADAEKNFFSNGHFTQPMHKWIEKQLANYLTSAHPELLQPTGAIVGAVSK
jgi:hypothetical protein